MKLRSAFVVLTLFAGVVLSLTPGTIHYQGKLTNTVGIGVNDTLDMVFLIYNVESGGTQLWSESHSDVPVIKGLFDVELGETVALNLQFNEQYWLEIGIGSFVMTPRIKLSYVPYAFRAMIADSLVGGGGGTDSDWQIDGVDMHSLPTGNVGIGTDAPSEKLHVVGNTRIEGHLYLIEGLHDGDGFGGANEVLLADGTGGVMWGEAPADSDWTVAGDNVYRNGGSVGIGTDTPLQALHIVGNIYGTGYFESGSTMVFDGTTNPGTITESHGKISFDDEILVTTGQIGIGTTTPDADLHVTGDVRVDGGFHDGTGTGGANQVIMADGSGGWSWAGDPGDGDWQVDGVDLYTMPTGNAGIGTNAPESKLHVVGETGYKVDVATSAAPAGEYFANRMNADITHDADVTGLYMSTVGETSPKVRGLLSEAHGDGDFSMGISASGFYTGTNTDVGITMPEISGVVGFGRAKTGTATKSWGTFGAANDIQLGNNYGAVGYAAQATNSNIGVLGAANAAPESVYAISGTPQGTGVYAYNHFPGGYALIVDGDAKFLGGINDGGGFGGADQVVVADGAGGWSWGDIPADGDWQVDGTNMYSIPIGDVGIGYTTPSQKLDVDGITKTHQLHLASGGTSGWENQIAWIASDRTTINHVLYTDASDGDKLKLDMGYSGSPADKVFEFTNGRVGFRTNEPDAALHIHSSPDCDTLGGGFIVLGDVGGANIVIDNNEIMARDDSSNGTLYIQLDGGQSDFGGDLHVGGDLYAPNGLNDGVSFGDSNQVAFADGLGDWDWKHFDMNTILDVDTAGLVDGQVLKWVAVANEWRPADDVGGATGADNWGTQVVMSDSSLLGDGTPGVAHVLRIDWDTLDAHINRYVDLTDLHNVDDTGVEDGEVLAWVDAANEWRPLDLSDGGLGDNWGTQIVETNASLYGDGTAGDSLGVNWDTLQAYYDSMIVLDDLQDVIIDTLGAFFILGWDHEDSLWRPHYDDDGDMNNELIDSVAWEPVDSVDTMFSTMRIIEHSVDWNLYIPVHEDSLGDNSIFELDDVDTTGLDEGDLMRWTFIETTFVGDDTVLVYKWVPVEMEEILDEHQLSDFGDVNDSTPGLGDVIQWLGTEWGPGIDIDSIINVWHDHGSYIAPLTENTVDFRIWDTDTHKAVTLYDTTGTLTGEWYGLYLDRRGAAASDGYGIYSYAGTAGGVSPGSEFYGVKGKASGGDVIYGLYGDGDYPGPGGTGYGVYGRGKTYGVYGRGTGANSYGVYGVSDDGFAGYFDGHGVFEGELSIIGPGSGLEGGQINLSNASNTTPGQDSSWVLDNYENDFRIFYSAGIAGGVTIEHETGNISTSIGRYRDKTGFVMPVGTVVPYAGATPPDGWLLCDGAQYDTVDYRDLYAVIEHRYGGSGDAFDVPDLVQRVPVGLYSGDTDFDQLGEKHGEKTHTLSVDEMPAHNHEGSTSTDGNHHHTVYFDDGGGGGSPTSAITVNSASCSGCEQNGWEHTTEDGNHHHTISSEGGGNAHNNMPPYTVLNYIIKY